MKKPKKLTRKQKLARESRRKRRITALKKLGWTIQEARSLAADMLDMDESIPLPKRPENLPLEEGELPSLEFLEHLEEEKEYIDENYCDGCGELVGKDHCIRKTCEGCGRNPRRCACTPVRCGECGKPEPCLCPSLPSEEELVNRGLNIVAGILEETSQRRDRYTKVYV